VSSRRIGILTSGGDCSGLNAVIRAASIRASLAGYELIGIKRGLLGLSLPNPEYILLDQDYCDELMLITAGSILRADTKLISFAMANGLSMQDIKDQIFVNYKALGLSGLICTGGDGSLQIISKLFCDNNEMNIIVVPKTIDNDVSGTDLSIGFQTAVEVTSHAIENIIFSAKSHERAMVVEVMGRDAGFIALYAGLASGADVILVPEIECDIEDIKHKVRQCFETGKNYCVLVVAESVETAEFRHNREIVDGIVKYTHLKYNGIGRYISSVINSMGIDARSVTLGHIQRGGRTCVDDRLLGTMFGVEAVVLLCNGISGKLLCYINNKVCSIDISTAIKDSAKMLSSEHAYIRLAQLLGIYIGKI
jgi:6-phosphofructokinase 1